MVIGQTMQICAVMEKKDDDSGYDKDKVFWVNPNVYRTIMD